MRLASCADEIAALPPAERHSVVGAWEIESRAAAYTTDLDAARAELRAARGQYAYLRHKAAGGRADAECPVCLAPLTEERALGSCGHALCCTCRDAILRRRSGAYVCPLCNRRGPPPAMASSLRWEDGSTAGARVAGSWGTKVTAVVRLILDLPEGAKCLVFSQAPIPTQSRIPSPPPTPIPAPIPAQAPTRAVDPARCARSGTRCSRSSRARSPPTPCRSRASTASPHSRPRLTRGGAIRLYARCCCRRARGRTGST